MATGTADGMRHGRIVSHSAGRLRVRLHAEHRDPAVLQAVERHLGGEDAIDSVATNSRTGSVLVHYDHRRLTREDVVELLWDAGLVARELIGAEELPEDLGRAESVAPHSSTATSLLDALTDLDARLSQLTGGRLDIKLLVPTGLGLLALRQIATAGLGLGQVPGYVLLWYTFDSFYKLHQRRAANIDTPPLGASPTGPA